MGFRLFFKWDFPVQSMFLPNSPSKPSPSSCKSSEANFLDSSRVSFPSVNPREDHTFYIDPFKACACSTALQTLENEYSGIEETMINCGKRSPIGLHPITSDHGVLVGENESAFLKRSKVSKASHFGLLMENLFVLEETFADSNVTRLERDIVVQLGRLGALNLFRTCLSRTLEVETSTNVNSVVAPNGLTIEDGGMKEPMNDITNNVLIPSSKKEDRRLRRKRALEKTNKISALSLPSKSIRKGPRKLNISSAKRPSNSTRRRFTITRNEAELSRGVKMVANLESLRDTMEKESGTVLSLSSWAKAAAIEKKVLQQHLHFGWSCRDELLRSTRSLVVYIARNYRGAGVAFEDLLQAGRLGVLNGAEKFDHTRGCKFSTYVHYWIRKSISTLVARHARGIHIPFALSRTIIRIQKARSSLYRIHGKYPDDDEIVKLTGLSSAKIQSASKCLRVVGSINQKIGEFPSAKLSEFMPDTSVKSPEESVMRQHMKRDIDELLKGLDLRERQVLVLRYGFGDHRRKSLEEIGRLFRVSKEWIRKIEKTALTKLRDEETCRNLGYYLDS